MLDKKKILGVGITNGTKKEILEYIFKILQNNNEKYYFVTPNPEFLVYASKHKDFKNILNNAELALNDGVGLSIAGRLEGKPLKQRVTGVDFMESLCKEVSRWPITVGFLGGGHRIAEMTAECLVSKFPGLKVVFMAEEWGEEGFCFEAKRGTMQNNTQNQAEDSVIGSQLSVIGSKSFGFQSVGLKTDKQKTGQLETENRELKTDNRDGVVLRSVPLGSAPVIDILFVAFGFPKQEEWIVKNLPNIPVRIAVGVGGSFDYISGKVPRAPVFIRKAGFEWLYRLIRQPWRIKRQIALLEFIYLVLKERIGLKMDDRM